MEKLTQQLENILAKRCIGRGKVMLAHPHNVEVEKVNITGFIEELINAVKAYTDGVIGADDRTVHMVGQIPIVPDSLGDKIRIEQRYEQRKTAEDNL